MKPDRKNANNPKAANAPVRSHAAEIEPTVAHAGHAPVWIFVALFVLIFWGMSFLDQNGGGFNPHVYQGFTSSNQLTKLVALPPGGEQVGRGLLVYNKPTCVSCHQATGQGTPGQFPPLVGTDWVLEPNPARLIRIVLHGLQGPIEVKGAHYANVMVPWKDVLNDEEVADVLTYVRKSWGNNAPAVSKDQVAKVREETKARQAYWTAEELLKIPVPAQ